MLATQAGVFSNAEDGTKKSTEDKVHFNEILTSTSAQVREQRKERITNSRIVDLGFSNDALK